MSLKLYKFQENLAKAIAEAMIDQRKSVPTLQTSYGRRDILLRAFHLYRTMKGTGYKLWGTTTGRVSRVGESVQSLPTQCFDETSSKRFHDNWYHTTGIGKSYPAFNIQQQIAAECQLPFKLSVKPTPYSNMINKKRKLTPREKACNKKWSERYDAQEQQYLASIAYERKLLNQEKELNATLRLELTKANEKVKICSRLLESIHTTAQSGATILGIK